MYHSLTSRTELIKGAKFLIGIAAFYTLFWLIISSISLYPLKSFAASTANGMLNGVGVPSTLVYANEPMIIIGELGAEIGNLCAGDIEIALLLAIIFATADRSWRRRIIGAAAGVLLITIVNPVRIFVVLYAGHAAGWGIADITHDILFRAMLILIIVVYYFLWYVKYDWFSDKLSKLGRDVNAVDGRTHKKKKAKKV